MARTGGIRYGSRRIGRGAVPGSAAWDGGGTSYYRDSVLLSPGGLNLHATAGGNEAYTIPIHLYAGVGITTIRLGAWNTNGVAYDVRRAYIGERECPGVVTENLATGFKTLLASPVTVSRLGSPAAPTHTVVGSVDVTGLVGDFVLVIEVGINAEKRAWGAQGISTGYGPSISGTNWTIQQLATVPSSGTFTPYAYTGFSASVLPNITVSCEGLSQTFLNPLIAGDSIAQGYGSQGSFMGKEGLGGAWSPAWEAATKPYIPLQLGWQGMPSTEIKLLLAALRAELGDRPVFLEGATINNWNSGYGFPDPGAQALTDLASNVAALGEVPYSIWLGFGWDAIDATGRGQIRSCYNSIEALHPSGLYGNETCGVMDPVTMLYLGGMSADGGHPNGTGWPLFTAANYAGATAWLDSLT